MDGWLYLLSLPADALRSGLRRKVVGFSFGTQPLKRSNWQSAISHQPNPEGEDARRACTDWANLFRAAGTGVTVRRRFIVKLKYSIQAHKFALVGCSAASSFSMAVVRLV